MLMVRTYQLTGRLILVACSCVVAGNAHAVKWERSLVFSPSLIYTDNVCLSKENQRSDWTGVAMLTPVGAVSVETSRTSARLGGSLSLNTLTDGDLRDDGCSGNQLEDRQRYFPRIYGTMKTTLLSDWLKMDANVRVDQNRVNSGLADSNDGLDRNGNTNTFYRYQLSPYMSRPVGDDMNFTGRYTYSEVKNSKSTVNDSHRHALNSGLSGGLGPRVTWNARGRYSSTGYSDDAVDFETGETIPRKDTVLRSVSLGGAYQINRIWEVDGRIGWEWNSFQSFRSGDDGGGAWDVGVKWTPSSRTSVSVGSGDRFFGQTPRVQFRHSRRNSVISGTYRKTITFQRDLSTYGLGSLDGSSLDTGDPLFNGGDSRFDANGDPVDGIGTTSSINSNSAILDERVTLRYSYTGRPGVITWFGSYSKQTRAEDGRQADFSDWQLNYRPDLSRKFSIIGSMRYEDVKPAGFVGSRNFGNNSNASQWTYRLDYVRPLNTRMNVSLGYRHTYRTADERFNEYRENMFRITLNFTL